MQLISFATHEPSGIKRHLGALIDGDTENGVIIDLSAAGRSLLSHEGVPLAGIERVASELAPDNSLKFIQNGARTLEFAYKSVEYVLATGEIEDPFTAQIRYSSERVSTLPSISNPPLLRDFMAFEEHLLNVYPKLNRPIPEEWYKRPVFYKGNTHSIGGNTDEILFPDYAEVMDFEFEFAIILGRDGINISEEKARKHIFGFTIYNDFSARAIQSQEMSVGLGPAKGKDFTRGHVLGPTIVTADEIDDPYALKMTAYVNGEMWTDGSSSNMHWKFEQMIAYASWNEELQAGEVFGSGTVGNGSGVEQDKFLVSGDRIELTVSKLGKLVNTVRRDSTYDPDQSKHGGREG
jgi:2-keto-4-pentenoate hydratase/2-oxohepta-3-ene-1,7-dioic acid hydratase in catechol pathway